MNTRPFLIHALSPLHAGIGHAADIIDLPIARMKATGIPLVPGSSIKGVLRDARSAGLQASDPSAEAVAGGGASKDSEQRRGRLRAVFGPEDDPSKHAGALVVGDAILLALPVRSVRGTFAWVSSPLLLTLAKRDLAAHTDAALEVPRFEPDQRGALVTDPSLLMQNERVYLEDLDLPASSAEANMLAPWTQLLAGCVFGNDGDIFAQRWAVVDDDTMAFLWETATQVDARVRLDESTRTVAQGALWLEESLPPETLLLGLLAAERSRREGVHLSPEEVLDFALAAEDVLQLGGHASIGRGRSRLLPLGLGGAAAKPGKDKGAA